MHKVIENKCIAENIYLMKVAGEFEGRMGQFYMLRAWDKYPLLSRPISIHDIDKNSISFLYEVVGEGTQILSKLTEGDTIKLEGPYGNGYEKVEGRIALVGGGLGVAPLYLAAKNLDNCDAYFGFREKPILEKEYKEVCKDVYISTGNDFVTDRLDVMKYDYILACGATPMMEKLVEMVDGTDTKIMVSLDNRMACGVGACLVCTCKTKQGNKKCCKDGPVFWGEDVIFNG